MVSIHHNIYFKIFVSLRFPPVVLLRLLLGIYSYLRTLIKLGICPAAGWNYTRPPQIHRGLGIFRELIIGHVNILPPPRHFSPFLAIHPPTLTNQLASDTLFEQFKVQTELPVVFLANFSQFFCK